MIEKESVEVEATSKNVRRDEAAANVQAAEAQSLKDECENELAEAIPALEGALAALDTLKVCFYSLNSLYPKPQDELELDKLYHIRD